VGTICKYAVVAEESDVVECVALFLRANEKEFIQTLDQGPPFASPSVDGRFPSIWTASEVKDGIVEVHVNNWERRSAFASFASFELQARLVVNNFQSTADACYWAFYLDGECRREIETTQDPLFDASGNKLSFEREHIGTDIAEDGEDPFFIFSYEDMNFYNAGVGVDIEVHGSLSSGWTNWTVLDPASGPRPKHRPARRSRSSWRFWA